MGCHLDQMERQLMTKNIKKERECPEIKVEVAHQSVFPGGASGKEPTCQCRRHKRRRFHLWVGKIPWRRRWQPTPVFLPGECHGQRSLVGYSSQGCKESDVTEARAHVSQKLGILHLPAALQESHKRELWMRKFRQLPYYKVPR